MTTPLRTRRREEEGADSSSAHDFPSAQPRAVSSPVPNHNNNISMGTIDDVYSGTASQTLGPGDVDARTPRMLPTSGMIGYGECGLVSTVRSLDSQTKVRTV